MKNSLKNKFRNEYEKQAEKPSAELWERIEMQLNQAEETEKQPAKRFFAFSFLKIAAVVLFLISAGFILNHYLNQPEVIRPVIVHNENAEPPKNISSGSSSDSVATYAKQHKEYTDENREILIPEKVADPAEKAIEKKETALAANGNSVIEKAEHLPKITENGTQKEIPEQKFSVPKDKVKYVTAQDLLFEREAGKSLREQENDQRKLGDIGLKIEKPKSVKVLGVTVYSDEEE